VIQTGRWQAAPYSYAQAHELSGALGLSATTASILARRGLGDPQAARRFLDASESHDPFAFTGMAEAVGLILRHIERGSLIAVHGDYDVDGVCSTALAVEALEGLGGRVHARLPSRTEDGYGLSDRTVRELSSQGTGLLVTADCGIGAVDQVALARSLRMDVIVTDHHRPGPELPDCALVHPGVCDYPCPGLCATGVVYKLCQALYTAAGRDPAELAGGLDLVALATVADLVPLVDENRMLVKEGLRALAGTARVGLRALMKVSGVEPQSVAEHTIGFVLAPRINAAGRLYRADAALELLLTRDSDRALKVAQELDAINAERRSVETRILFEAEGQLSAATTEQRDEPLHVLAGEGWHAGVIGIVASRLVERYHRPFVLIALDESGDGRGSGRSIPAYDLHAGLAACSHRLRRFGGHRMAAGLEIEGRYLEPFRAGLVAHARTHLRPEDLVAVERVDAIVPGDVVGLGLAEELDLLRPFGMGNPGVNLLVPAARVSDVRPMGEGRHARLTVKSAGVNTRAVVFGAGDRLIAKEHAESRHDLVGRLEANEWGGAVEPRLVLRSLHPVGVESRDEEAGTAGCSECTCRARGGDWWARVWREFDEGAEDVSRFEARDPRVRGTEARQRVVIDSRDHGALGCLSDLLSTGESVLVTCADASRRRGLLAQELDPARFGRPPGRVLSSHCALDRIAEGVRSFPAAAAFCLADYQTVAENHDILAGFTHVFGLDPPTSDRLRFLLSASGGAGEGPWFLHLGWGDAELEFAQKAHEHEYSLRTALTSVYRDLATRTDGLSGPALEAALMGAGRHPRSPALVGRCLRVLVELGLVELDRSSATVRCTIIGQGKANLDDSQAFQRYRKTYEEGLRFLSGLAQPMRTASAA
jgi:single-stranded-DNA-specific exonuclease